MDNIIGFLAFIFILGAAVILHEFGHFIVAKMLGIRVETFSVGFGKRLFGRRWGTTDYRLSLIPLGGYVKLGGDDSNAGIEEGSNEVDIPVKERFDLRPRWQKFLVGVAGPVMNILTAIAIPFVAAMMHGIPATPSPVIMRVQPDGAAAQAGIKPGDRIKSFNGKENPTWRRIEGDALLSPDQQIPVVVERNGQDVALSIKPIKRTQGGEAMGDLGMQADFGIIPVVVEEVRENSPAFESGLRPGDRIVSVGEEMARNNAQVKQYIETHPGSIKLVVERGGERKELTTPERRLEGNTLGFGFGAGPLEQVGVFSALGHAVEMNVEIIRLTGKAIGQIFSGQRSARDTLAGPIGIARESSRAANELGWAGVFTLLGFLSLNLGIFNLLPIPVLDGGMIFMLFVEGALSWVGVKLSMTVRERIQQVGFVFLLLLMGFVIINDITKLASSGSGDNQNKPAATASPSK
jgi:regulator of sigma E protease